MKRKIILILIFLTVVSLNLYSRLKFIGPNPYFSFTHFPQDSRFFYPKSSIFFLSYRNPGWMGNLDDPFRSPSALYVNTEESVEENFDGTRAKASFSGTWFNTELISAPYIYDLKGIRIIPLVGGQFDSFSLEAKGNAIAHSYENYWLVPFSSKVTQKNYSGNLGLILSTSIKEFPMGLIFNYSRMEEGNPSGFIQYSQNGREIKMNRYTWGWSASSGCQKIFGTSTNIDAFWQDSFTDSKRDQLDFVFGMDIRDHKIGIRYRNINVHGEYYSYSRTLDKYLPSDTAEKVTAHVFRPYAVFSIKDFGNTKIFGVSVLEIDLLKERPLSKKGKEFLNSYNERKLTSEFLPFAHFDLERGFLRFGSGFSFGYKWYDYTDIWGRQKVYQQSTAYFDWESSWEHSSYGNEISLINFSDLNTELLLERKFNSTLRLEVFRMITYYRTKRFYGKNIYDGESYNFFQTAERINTLKEDWFGGTIGIFFGKKISIGLFMDIPIFYKKSVSTKVKGKTSEFFEGFRDFQPQIREPFKFWIMVVLK